MEAHLAILSFSSTMQVFERQSKLLLQIFPPSNIFLLQKNSLPKGPVIQTPPDFSHSIPFSSVIGAGVYLKGFSNKDGLINILNKTIPKMNYPAAS